MPAQPSLGLHANRRYSVPSVSRGTRGPNYNFSVQNILTGKVASAFCAGQSMSVCVDGEEEVGPPVDGVPANTWPKKWFRPHTVLRVPKVVILSSVPFWTLFWPRTYFYGNRDVIGQDPATGIFNNYYYFDQWNTQDIGQGDSRFDTDSTPPNQTYKFGNPNYDYSSIQTVSNDTLNQYNCGMLESQVTTAMLTASITIQAEPCYVGPGGVGDDPGPKVRFSQVVGQLDNSCYYDGHQHLIDQFVRIKKALEADPIDPIFVLIPTWMPYRMYQCYNSFLKRNVQHLNPGHGGAVNYRPCDISDSIPCYNYEPTKWNPVYPEIFDPRNGQGFNANQVPWLSTANPGFGTNVLHMYVGHPVMKYFNSSSIFDYQAFPLTPEVQWLAGPVYAGLYTGDTQPYFAGRRLVWKTFGYDYGYTGTITADSLYNTRYHGIVESAAAQYKANFYEFRNLATRIMTYASGLSPVFNGMEILKDRERTCPATQGYFGFETFADYAAIYDNEDDSIEDCSWVPPAFLKFGETTNAFPDAKSLNIATEMIYPGIEAHIRAYYDSIEPGSQAFFQKAIDINNMDEFDVQLDDPVDAGSADSDFFISYIKEYFKNAQ